VAVAIDVDVAVAVDGPPETAPNNRQDVAVEVLEAPRATTNEIAHDWDAAVPMELDPAARVLDQELDILEHALQELDRDRPAAISG